MSLRSSLMAFIATQFILSGIAQAAVEKLETDQWYRVKRLTQTSDLVLVPGTEFTVLEMSEDGQFAHIAIDDGGASEPQEVWVSSSELMASEPQFVDIEAIEALKDLGIEFDSDAEIQTWWEESGLLGQAQSTDPGKMTYCLRDVRITAAKYTSKKNIPQGISRAAIAYPAYRAKGWKPIKYATSNPDGTACFYGGGRMDCCVKTNSKGRCSARGACGHAAIKIGKNKWKGAGIRPVPHLPNRKGRIYIPHGCLTPPPR